MIPLKPNPLDGERVPNLVCVWGGGEERDKHGPSPETGGGDRIGKHGTWTKGWGKGGPAHPGSVRASKSENQKQKRERYWRADPSPAPELKQNQPPWSPTDEFWRIVPFAGLLDSFLPHPARSRIYILVLCTHTSQTQTHTSHQCTHTFTHKRTLHTPMHAHFSHTHTHTHTSHTNAHFTHTASSCFRFQFFLLEFFCPS